MNIITNENTAQTTQSSNFANYVRSTLVAISNLPAIAKFSIVILCLFLYFLYAYHKHGVKESLLLTALVWCFFILFTPLPDADVIVSFPVRVLWDIPMQYVELIVYVIAIAIVAIAYISNRNVFTKSALPRFLLNTIEIHSAPYIAMLITSAIIVFTILYVENSIYTAFMKDDYAELNTTSMIAIAVGILISASIYIYSAIYISKQRGGLFR